MKLDNKGQVATGVIVGVIGIAIVLIVGLTVFSNVEDIVDTAVEAGSVGYSDQTAFNATVDNISTNFNSGLTLGSVLAIVIFAGLVIASVAFVKAKT